MFTPKQNLYEETESDGVLMIRARVNREIVGMVVESRYADGSACFTSYLSTSGGSRWFEQDSDGEKVKAGLRSRLYADCEYCGEWPCPCTEEDRREQAAERAAWRANANEAPAAA